MSFPPCQGHHCGCMCSPPLARGTMKGHVTIHGTEWPDDGCECVPVSLACPCCHLPSCGHEQLMFPCDQVFERPRPVESCSAEVLDVPEVLPRHFLHHPWVPSARDGSISPGSLGDSLRPIDVSHTSNKDRAAVACGVSPSCLHGSDIIPDTESLLAHERLRRSRDAVVMGR